MGMITENNIRAQAKKDAEALRLQMDTLITEQRKTNALLEQVVAALQPART